MECWSNGLVGLVIRHCSDNYHLLHYSTTPVPGPLESHLQTAICGPPKIGKTKDFFILLVG